MEYFRAIVRPLIALAVIGMVAYLVSLVRDYFDVNMARDVLIWVLASGTAIIGVYYGLREAKKK